MAPPHVPTTAHDLPLRSSLHWKRGSLDATSTSAGRSAQPMNHPPLVGTKRARALSSDSADGEGGEIALEGQIIPAPRAKFVGPTKHIRLSSSPASTSVPLPGCADVHPSGLNSNGTKFDESGGKELFGEDADGARLIYAGSFWHVQVALTVAPAHDAELMARYTPGSIDNKNQEVGIFEAHAPTGSAVRDGKQVGWVLNNKFNHADQLATLLNNFGEHDIQVISRRKNTSRPFLDDIEAGSALEPPVSLHVGNFKVHCKQHVRESIVRQLMCMQLPGSQNIHVEGFACKAQVTGDTVAGAPAGMAGHVAPDPANQGIKSAAHHFDHVDSRLQAACGLLRNARCLTPSQTPAQMQMPLRGHQQMALSWMVRREQGKPLNDVFVREDRGPNARPVFFDVISGTQYEELPVTESGGILADDMGMGKTMTAIAFIVACLENAQAWVASFDRVGDGFRSPATLLVVPPNLVSHWEREIRTKTKLAMGDLYVHFGPNRVDDRAAWAGAKIVLTSSSLVSLAGQRDRDMFFNTHWYRAIFDEAHEFRNANTRLARNVLRIQAKFRWAITGTPIHNYVADIQPLLQLINAPPVSSRTKFNDLVLRRLQTHPRDGSLVLKVLAGSYMIRRRAEENMYSASFTHVKAEVALSQEERQLYEEARSRVMLEIQHETSCHNALLRFHDMRKVCAMGVAAKASMRPSSAQAVETPSAKYQRAVFDCGASCLACGEVPSLDSATGEKICFILSCTEEHLLCPACFKKESGRCPCEVGPDQVTSTPVTRADLEDLDVEMTDRRDERPSAKLRFIRDEVKAYPGAKFVVMASYVCTVSEIIRVLDMEAVTLVRYDGSISQAQRRANLAVFKKESGVQVLVGTIKSLGQGHSVEQASRLILVDVEWNPQVSEQAKARILRLNQQNDATITQLVAKGTIEENVLARAEDKKRLAETFSDHWNVVQRAEHSDLDLIKSWFRN